MGSLTIYNFSFFLSYKMKAKQPLNLLNAFIPHSLNDFIITSVSDNVLKDWPDCFNFFRNSLWLYISPLKVIVKLSTSNG